MTISEQELRAMIRDAIARHGAGRAPQLPAGIAHGAPRPLSPLSPSHALFVAVPSGSGECIIEPSVSCNHCGYCKSLGH